jgi:peptidoglycan/LPS O-acetylase OafA/YrhL
LCVCFWHSLCWFRIYLATGIGEEQPLYKWTNYTLGQHGVQIFFFLSGILVAQSLFVSRSLRDFATARALRIFPALIVCVLLTALIVGPLASSLPPMDYLRHHGVAAYIAKTATLWSGSARLPEVFARNPVPGDINLSVWTLKYEFACYAVLGVAGYLVLKLKRWREVAFALLAAWAVIVLIKPVGLELHGTAKSNAEVLRYFSIFFGMGVLAYALRQWIPIHTVMLIPLGAMFWSSIGGRFQEVGAAIFLGYLALWVSTFRFGSLRNFTNSNDYSYATYLYHYPVSQSLLHVWPDMHVLPLILATTGITLWLAFFSWELVERPALAMRHRLWAKTPHSAESAFDAALAVAKAGRANAATSMPASASAPASAAPMPITRQTASVLASAAATSARASERLVREMATQTVAAKTTVATAASQATSAVTAKVTAATHAIGTTPPTLELPPMPAASAPAPIMTVASKPAATEPGSAHVWRPMPSARKLRILDEPMSDTAPASAEAPVALTVADPRVDAALSKARSAQPANLIRRAKEGLGVQARPTPAVDEPLPPVPSSRIAFATKRPAAADLVQKVPVVAPVPVEPSRAVVAVD